MRGETASTSGGAAAVEGEVTSTSPGGFSAAVRGINSGTASSGIGVHGSQDGSGWGVYGETPSGRGVFGRHTSGTGTEPGVKGLSDSTSAGASGVTGELSTNASGLNAAGVRGINNGLGTTGIGVFGSHAGSGWGVYGAAPNGRGVFGYHTGSSGDEPGVKGRTDSNSDLAAGVFGEAAGSGFVNGVYGQANEGIGVLGGGAVGVLGFGAIAGYFAGNVHVAGTLTKAAGSFRIDHPLEPAKKFLQHSFVESPDMMNVYNGNVRTDRRGFATVRLPRYFSALNRNFRYQLTSLSGLQDVAVAREIEGNRFVIQSEEPSSRVSWQVTGIRKDRYANDHRIQPEIAKNAADAGAVKPAHLRALRTISGG